MDAVREFTVRHLADDRADARPAVRQAQRVVASGAAAGPVGNPPAGHGRLEQPEADATAADARDLVTAPGPTLRQVCGSARPAAGLRWWGEGAAGGRAWSAGGSPDTPTGGRVSAAHVAAKHGIIGNA
jgi:hypothetical protein